MGIVKQIYFAPEMLLFKYILLVYLGLYITVFALTRIFIALRGQRTYPAIDQIAYKTLMWCFVLQTVVPVYVIVDNILHRGFSNLWYFLPYSVVSLINILIIFNLFGKNNPSSNS